MAELPIRTLKGHDFHNLIPSRFPPVPIYKRIASGREDWFASIEVLTNPRIIEKRRLTMTMAPSDQEGPRLTNWNHAPFSYPNPTGTRFFGANHKVLELADDLQTALAISVAKREAFLSDASVPSTVIEMRQLKRRVRGKFLDTRSEGVIEEGLRRIEIGEEAIAKGLDGLLYRPAERKSGTSIVLLCPDGLENPVQADHFKFVWDGERIEVVYSFGDGKRYDPNGFRQDRMVIGA